MKSQKTVQQLFKHIFSSPALLKKICLQFVSIILLNVFYTYTHLPLLNNIDWGIFNFWHKIINSYSNSNTIEIIPNIVMINIEHEHDKPDIEKLKTELTDCIEQIKKYEPKLYGIDFTFPVTSTPADRSLSTLLEAISTDREVKQVIISYPLEQPNTYSETFPKNATEEEKKLGLLYTPDYIRAEPPHELYNQTDLITHSLFYEKQRYFYYLKTLQEWKTYVPDENNTPERILAFSLKAAAVIQYKDGLVPEFDSDSLPEDYKNKTGRTDRRKKEVIKGNIIQIGRQKDLSADLITFIGGKFYDKAAVLRQLSEKELIKNLTGKIVIIGDYYNSVFLKYMEVPRKIAYKDFLKADASTDLTPFYTNDTIKQVFWLNEKKIKELRASYLQSINPFSHNRSLHKMKKKEIRTYLLTKGYIGKNLGYAHQELIAYAIWDFIKPHYLRKNDIKIHDEAKTLLLILSALMFFNLFNPVNHDYKKPFYQVMKKALLFHLLLWAILLLIQIIFLLNNLFFPFIILLIIFCLILLVTDTFFLRSTPIKINSTSKNRLVELLKEKKNIKHIIYGICKYIEHIDLKFWENTLPKAIPLEYRCFNDGRSGAIVLEIKISNENFVKIMKFDKTSSINREHANNREFALRYPGMFNPVSIVNVPFTSYSCLFIENVNMLQKVSPDENDIEMLENMVKKSGNGSVLGTPEKYLLLENALVELIKKMRATFCTLKDFGEPKTASVATSNVTGFFAKKWGKKYEDILTKHSSQLDSIWQLFPQKSDSSQPEGSPEPDKGSSQVEKAIKLQKIPYYETGFMHGDLNPRNIVLTAMNIRENHSRYDAYLIDFANLTPQAPYFWDQARLVSELIMAFTAGRLKEKTKNEKVLHDWLVHLLMYESETKHITIPDGQPVKKEKEVTFFKKLFKTIFTTSYEEKKVEVNLFKQLLNTIFTTSYEEKEVEVDHFKQLLNTIFTTYYDKEENKDALVSFLYCMLMFNVKYLGYDETEENIAIARHLIAITAYLLLQLTDQKGAGRSEVI